MKVLFLDHDGVMCLAKQFGGRFSKRKKYAKEHGSVPDSEMPVFYRLDNFDKKAVHILNEILEETGAEIVVTSDWKKYATLEEMGELYTLYGVNKIPVDYTPFMKDFDELGASMLYWKGYYESVRAGEIREWLKNHPEVTAWVAVDDLDMGRDGLENFVLTPRVGEGIKQSGVKEKIIELFSRQSSI